MRTLKTEVDKSNSSHHENKAFDRTDYLTPVATNFPSQYLTILKYLYKVLKFQVIKNKV